MHALVQPVLIVVAPQQHMHALCQVLAHHDHAGAVAVDISALVQQLASDGSISDHDHRGAAELGTDNRAILLGPLVESPPWQLSRCLVEITDEGETRRTWRDMGISSVLVEEPEQD